MIKIGQPTVDQLFGIQAFDENEMKQLLTHGSSDPCPIHIISEKHLEESLQEEGDDAMEIDPIPSSSITSRFTTKSPKTSPPRIASFNLKTSLESRYNK